MTAATLDGKATLAAIKQELTGRVAALRAAGVVPGLGTVLVGDDPGSRWYVNAKHKDSQEIGVNSIRRELPATATLEEVLAVVDELNADPECTAFLVQQPTGLDEFAILSRVDPAKDVDGLHPFNLGALVLGEPAPVPCTPAGIIELLRRYEVPIAGAEVVIIGRGITVGRPLGLMLVPAVGERDRDPVPHPHPRPRRARPLMPTSSWPRPASPGLITKDMVKPGAAVLDVGVSRVDGKIAGDVAADVPEVAGWFSPNPGGVGPMTRALLLSNVVAAAERRAAALSPDGLSRGGARAAPDPERSRDEAVGGDRMYFGKLRCWSPSEPRSTGSTPTTSRPGSPGRTGPIRPPTSGRSWPRPAVPTKRRPHDRHAQRGPRTGRIRLQGRRPLARRLRPQGDPARRARDAGADGAARGVRPRRSRWPVPASPARCT